MKLLLPILFTAFLFSGELEVDGDLKVTGTVESTTIDSLKMVIAQLQAQLVAMQAQLNAMQVDNKLETRVYEYEASMLSNIDLDFTLSELTNGDLDDNQSAFIKVLAVADVSTLNINFNIKLVRSYLGEQVDEDWFGTIYSLGNNQPLYSAQNYLATYNGIFDHAFRAINSDFIGTLELAITAEFPE